MPQRVAEHSHEQCVHGGDISIHLYSRDQTKALLREFQMANFGGEMRASRVEFAARRQLLDS